MRNYTVVLVFCLPFVLLYGTSFGQSYALDPTFGTGGIVITDDVGPFEKDIPRAMAVLADDRIVVVGEVSDGPSDFGVVRYLENGILDPSFDFDGKTSTNIDFGTDRANSIAVQTDGKIVVAGSSQIGWVVEDKVIALVRYRNNGSKDNSFGGDGKVMISFASLDLEISGQSIAIQNDGKILLACWLSGGVSPSNFMLVRLMPDGSFDNTFDGDGLVYTSVGTSGSGGRSVLVQEDGKIVVTGFSHNSDSLRQFSLVRYQDNGSLDNTFGEGGIVLTNLSGFNENCRVSKQQVDGKIVVLGDVDNGTNKNLLVVRYNTDGSLDDAFGIDGGVTVDIASFHDLASSLAIQTDGKIVIAGSSGNGTNYDFAVVRLTNNGTLDSSFYGNGIVRNEIGEVDDIVTGVGIQSDGKIIVCGFLYNYEEFWLVNNIDFVVARYRVDGTTGLESEIGSQSQIIYPNPSSGTINLRWNRKENASLNIFNSLGQEVLQQQITQSTSVELLEKGVYFARLDDGQRIYLEKIVIQ